MKLNTLLMAASVATAGSLVLAAPAWAQCGPPAPAQAEGTERTIEARVVDQSCYLVHGLQGDMHKECAEVCARQGVPLVFLGDDGNIYLPVSVPMPSESHNPQLIDHAEQKVKVTGTVNEKAGTRTITVDQIERAS